MLIFSVFRPRKNELFFGFHLRGLVGYKGFSNNIPTPFLVLTNQMAYSCLFTWWQNESPYSVILSAQKH